MTRDRDEFDEPSETRELIAYRLGRLEKAVDAINRHSIERDDMILEKLEKVSEVAERVSQNSWRISSLEQSRSNQMKALTTLGIAVLVIFLELLFNVVRGPIV